MEQTKRDLHFTVVMHFAFSVNLFGAMIGGGPETGIDALFRSLSDALSKGLPMLI